MLRLLSTAPQITWQGQVLALRLTKPALLLCYLALQGKWVSRLGLATLLRPDSDEQVARHNLRLLVNRAKSLPWASGLEIQTQRLRFTMPTDVQAFQIALGRTDWVSALEVYQAPLLSGVSFNSPAFDEWLLLERNQLEGAWREAMLTQSQVLASAPLEAAALLWRLWQHDEFDEMILGRYLRTAYLAGQRELALAAYKKFGLMLESEFGQVPTLETQRIFERILAAQPLEPKAVVSVVPMTISRPPLLVARSFEVAVLQTSQAPMLVVLGEGGVGKTRLLLEVFANARLLRCTEGLEEVSYAPLIAWANGQYTPERAALLGVYAEDIARVLPEFSTSVAANSDSLGGKMRLFEAFARLLELESAPVLFDDLQWADAATLEFLTFFLARRKVRLLATIRHNEMHPKLERYLQTWQAERLVLKPFSLPDVTALLSSLIGSDSSYPIFSQFLHRQTGGNPFFILEVLRDLFARGALRVSDHDWKSALDGLTTDYSEFIVPTRVQDLVLRRVARLSETAKRVIGAACVLQNIGLTGLGFLTDLPEAIILDSLEELEAAAMIRNEQLIHDLLRQSVYQNLSMTRRKHWHERAGKLPSLGRLARAEHLILANLMTQAVPLLLEESLVLQRLGLPAEAIKSLERILQHQPQHLEALANSALCLVQLHQYDLALEQAKMLLLHSSQPRYKAIAWRTQADWYYSNGDLTKAAERIEAALALIGQFEYTQSYFEEIAFDIFEAQQRYPEIIVMLQAARLRLAKLGESGDLAIILSSLAAVYDDTKRYPEALDLHFQALNMTRRTGARYAQVSVSLQMMWALNYADRALEATQIAEEALSYGQFSNTQYLRNGYAASLMHLELYEEALVQYQNNALNGDITTRTLAWGRSAELLHRLGRTAEIANAVQQALLSALETQVSFAQIRAVIAILKFGTQSQLEQLLPQVLMVKSPDPISQGEYESALEIAKQRGLSVTNGSRTAYEQKYVKANKP